MNEHLERLLRLTRPLSRSEAEQWAIEAGAGRENASSDDPIFLQDIQAFKHASPVTTARPSPLPGSDATIGLPGTSATA